MKHNFPKEIFAKKTTYLTVDENISKIIDKSDDGTLIATYKLEKVEKLNVKVTLE
jgi:hypothetical protein